MLLVSNRIMPGVIQNHAAVSIGAISLLQKFVQVFSSLPPPWYFSPWKCTHWKSGTCCIHYLILNFRFSYFLGLWCGFNRCMENTIRRGTWKWKVTRGWDVAKRMIERHGVLIPGPFICQKCPYQMKWTLESLKKALGNNIR